MSSEWQVIPLSKIVTYSQGIQIPIEEQELENKEGFGRFIRIVDYTTPSEAPRYIKLPNKKSLVDKNDIVMIRYGSQSAGRVVRGIEGFIANNMFKIIINSDIDVDKSFLYRFLTMESIFGYLRGTQSSSTMPAITFGMMNGIQIKLPSKKIQSEVAIFFDTLDDRITLLRETNATLEAIAQALFKSWFVDFDPVHAKAQGRQPEGMDEQTAALFPDRFVESELGMVPLGWEVGTLATFAILNPESWTTQNHPRTLSYVDLANTKENEIAAVTEYTFEDAPSRARRVLQSGDTIIGTVRPGNRSFAFIHKPEKNLTGSTGFAVLRPSKKQYTEFVYLASTQDSNIEHLAHVADGGAYPAVRPEVVLNLKCVVPCNAEIQRFHEITSPLLGSISENKKQAKTLANLRDTLLPRLISGQLRLPDVEA
jgi:type I restriction enzyme S subunit